jgi:hypothetical protein
VLVASAYLLTHALTLWSGMPADGFSSLYVHGAGLSAIVAFGIGLAFLRRVLLRLYSHAGVTATLLVIALGSNLLHYATWDPLYSQIYSFALISALLWLVPAWFADPTTKRSVLLGLLAGFHRARAASERALLLLVPLYGVIGPRDVGARIRMLAARGPSVALAAVVFGVVLFPQLALYRAATGQWFVSSYGDQWFDFAHPRIAGVLFSVRKGLFFCVSGADCVCRWFPGRATRPRGPARKRAVAARPDRSRPAPPRAPGSAHRDPRVAHARSVMAPRAAW